MTDNWLEKQMEKPEFRRLLATEDFIEDFMNEADRRMKEKGMNHKQLAKMLGRDPYHITIVMQRRREITASMMANIAFHLGMKLSLKWEKI